MDSKEWYKKHPIVLNVFVHAHTQTNTYAHTVTEPTLNIWLWKASKPGNSTIMHCLDYASATLPEIIDGDSDFHF